MKMCLLPGWSTFLLNPLFKTFHKIKSHVSTIQFGSEKVNYADFPFQCPLQGSGELNGALDVGPQCHVSNLRNDNVACPLTLHVACRL